MSSNLDPAAPVSLQPDLTIPISSPASTAPATSSAASAFTPAGASAADNFTSGGGASGGAAAAEGGASAAPAVPYLPTGEKVYELHVPNFTHWNTDDEFKMFCNFLNGYANPPTTSCSHPKPASAFRSYMVLNTPGPQQPVISHGLLAADGFVLGHLLAIGTDEEVVDQSRFAIYTVLPDGTMVPTHAAPQN